jgi:type IV pilus assembly protein PilM
MSLWKQMTRLISDPPPAFAFELSEAGLAWTRRRTGGLPQIGFEPLDPDVLGVSPVRDNVLRPEALAARIRAIGGVADHRKRRRTAVILPDYCGRIAVLDFDAFPADPHEQLSLVRFRMKKTVPFDIDSAAIRYQPQPHSGKGKRVEVIVAALAIEILARYEAVFRAAGFHPGFVTTSGLAGLDLLRNRAGVNVLVKLTGRVLTVSVLQGRVLKLIRCVELPEAVEPEIMAVLYPTFAYIEDELGQRPASTILCGFGQLDEHEGARWQDELGSPVEHLRSRLGLPGQTNSGLLGYLESLQE